jgi:hypothetical protein
VRAAQEHGEQRYHQEHRRGRRHLELITGCCLLLLCCDTYEGWYLRAGAGDLIGEGPAMLVTYARLAVTRIACPSMHTRLAIIVGGSCSWSGDVK